MDFAHEDNSIYPASDESTISSSGTTARILVVEDNHLNKKLFRDLLQIKGHEIFEAEDGDRGIEMARSLCPDLILLDIYLPTVSGLDVAKALKADQATDHIPIIAVTAFAMVGHEETVRAAGCDGYLAKPISIDSFFESVNSFLCPIAVDAI
jgi:two-component system cell cycle response regulator DivK